MGWGEGLLRAPSQAGVGSSGYPGKNLLHTVAPVTNK